MINIKVAKGTLCCFHITLDKDQIPWFHLLSQSPYFWRVSRIFEDTEIITICDICLKCSQLTNILWVRKTILIFLCLASTVNRSAIPFREGEPFKSSNITSIGFPEALGLMLSALSSLSGIPICHIYLATRYRFKEYLRVEVWKRFVYSPEVLKQKLSCHILMVQRQTT